MSISLPPSILSHMPEETKKEFLSKAYVRAVAAHAGVNIEFSEADFGVDISFTRIKSRPGRRFDTSGLALKCQLKSSMICHMKDDHVVYDLDAKNYNDLVNSAFGILIVLWLPSNIDNWIMQDENSLSISKCAYYLDLFGRKETSNKEKQRVFIPKSQIFTVEALLRLIDQVQKRVQPL